MRHRAPRRHGRLVVAAALCVPVLALPTTAPAHQGNPNMESVVSSLHPHVPGVRLQVLNRDDRFQLTNHGTATIIVLGYDREPYARLTPDGTVAVNHNSPAYYLNDDRYAAVTVPHTAGARATPDWHVLDRTGVFEWHDHRMHYMARGVPPVVKDRNRRTKVFDYAIPIRIGATQGAIDGTLWWVPTPGGGAPVGAIVALIVLGLGGGAAIVVVRRRRRDDPGTGAAAAGADSGAEAW
jgi:hypothetical protein